MIVSLVGAAGGVGTSTFGLLLAVALQEQRQQQEELPDLSATDEITLIEADPSGGVAGARFELGVADGLQAWVAGLATEPSLSVDRFGKRIADGLRVVPGPLGTADAERVLTPGVFDMLAAAMTRNRNQPWVVDLGRGAAATSPIADIADATIIVASGLAEHVVRLPTLVAASPATTVVAMGGSSTWSAAEVQHHCHADAVIAGPDFRLPAGQVVDLVEGRRRRRSLVWRSVLRCRDAVIESVADLERGVG